MSVTVTHLNADSSFLLRLSPQTGSLPSDPEKAVRPYTILIDPWLSGPSIVGRPWFVRSHHTTPSCISHLSEIEEPDLVIISQNKRDHCHEATLRQLCRETKALIVAEPTAAKTIRGYNYFKSSGILAMRKYHPDKPSTVLRFSVAPLTPSGDAGEVTVAFIPARNYITGVHNAIGITYRAPTTSRFPASTVSVPVRTPSRESSLDRILSPRLSRRFFARDHSTTVSLPTTPSMACSPMSPLAGLNATRGNQHISDLPPTPPETPTSTSTFASTIPTILSPATTAPLISPAEMKHIPNQPPQFSRNHPQPLSILYTPHGIPFDPDLQPYVTNHLQPLSALPLTLLLHSLNRSHNPWYLGGTITAGAKGGGVQMARALGAQCWVGAHDEEKDNRGCGVKLLRTERNDVEEVRRALDKETTSYAEGEGGRKWRCEVRILDVGEEVMLPAR